MAKTVIALYDSMTDAQNVVQELVDRGFERESISLMAQHTGAEREREVGGGERAAEGAGVGAGIGAAVGGIGGLLAGLGALTIPGIGPVVAAGPIIATIAGAGMGVGVGAVVGALVGMGVPEEQSNYYAEGVRRGGILVSVRTSNDMANWASDIMEQYNPVDVDQRASEWRKTGWSHFDPNAGPYRSDESRWTDTVVSRTRTEGMGPGTGQDRGLGVGPAEPTRRPTEDVERPLGEDMSSRVPPPEETRPEMGQAIERAMGQGTPEMLSMRSFGDLEGRFRSHFQSSYPNTRYQYDQYRPAYQYGFDLARNETQMNREWDDVEPEAQRQWEAEHDMPWADVRLAVRESFYETRRGTAARGAMR